MEVAKIEFAPKVHSEIGASGYSRYKVCPGSVKLIREKAPPELPDEEVREDGIEAHGLGEVILKAKDAGARAVVKAKFLNNGGDPKMFDYVYGYTEYVRLLATSAGATLGVEQSFNLSWLHPNLFGTTDATVYQPAGLIWDMEKGTYEEMAVLHVIDFKYGFYPVYAEGHLQTLYYALGAYAALREEGKQIDRIVLHIYQPRVPGRSDCVDTWACDEKYLEGFAIKLRADAQATEAPDAPLVPGKEQCRLCRARTVCPELAKPAYMAARLQLEATGQNPNTLEPLEVVMASPSLMYKVAELARVYADGVLTRTRSEMVRGQKYDGLKLVAPRGSRTFVKPGAIMEMFPAESHPDFYVAPDLKSPFQVIELIKAKMPDINVQEFEKKHVLKLFEGEPIVAHADDKRLTWDRSNIARDEWKDEIEEAREQTKHTHMSTESVARALGQIPPPPDVYVMPTPPAPPQNAFPPPPPLAAFPPPPGMPAGVPSIFTKP